VNCPASSDCFFGLQTMACHTIVSGDRDRSDQDMQIPSHDRPRFFSASFCLLAVVLLYAPFAAAAWSSYSAACCTTAQCPIKAHHHQSQNSPPSSENHMDCGHDMAGMTSCDMSCCQNTERPGMASLSFVLPEPVNIPQPIASVAETTKFVPTESLLSFDPPSPPPRTSLFSS
jgi:hypothetical protein